MAKGWFSKLWDYGFNKAAWDQHWNADNATSAGQDLSTLWNSFTKYGFNGAAWRSDPEAQRVLDTLWDEVGDIAKTGAAVAGVGAVTKMPVIGSASKWLWNAAKSPTASKYVWAPTAGAVTNAVLSNAVNKPEEPKEVETPEYQDPYAQMARQMYLNQPQQMFYGGFYGGSGGGGNRRRSTGLGSFRGW